MKTDKRVYFYIFSLAFIVRFLFLLQIAGTPIFNLLMNDAAIYDIWAQNIVKGNWLGSNAFFQAPLYPYFLAILYKIFTHNLFWIRLVQIIMGSVSCVLISLAGKHLFSEGAGIAAGLIIAIYPTAIFFDFIIQKAFLGLFFMALLILVLCKSMRDQGSYKIWLFAGIIMALLGLTRENAFVLLPVIIIWLIIHFRHLSLMDRISKAGLFLLGVIIILSPVAIRNKMVSGEYIITTFQFGTNLYIGNTQGADGLYRPLIWGEGDTSAEMKNAIDIAQGALGRHLSPSEVSHYWTKKALSYIISHPREWMLLMFKKWRLLLNSLEIGDTEDIYTYAMHSGLLKVLITLFHFGVITTLAILGICVTLKQWRRLWLLYIMICSYAASVTFFFIFSRYRYPIMAILAIFAGAGTIKAIELFRMRAYKILLPAFTVTLLFAIFINWPVMAKPEEQMIAGGHYNFGNALLDKGKPDMAIKYYNTALKYLPFNVQVLNNLGKAHQLLGNLNEAMTYYIKAIEIKPDFAVPYHNIGLILTNSRMYEAAISHYLQALKYQPDSIKSHYQIAIPLMKTGRIEEAIKHYYEVLRLAPDSPEALSHLAWIMVTCGDHEVRDVPKAIELAIRASDITSHERIDILEILAAIYAEAGQFEDAIVIGQKALEVAQSQQRVQIIEGIKNRLALYQKGETIKNRLVFIDTYCMD